MNKKSFLRWYIGEGLQEAFSIWRRLIIFIPRFFSVTLLLRTLLAPWHRDVSLKNWRGFSIAKSTEKIIWNAFSRIIGAIWRLLVIGFAIITWIVVIIFGGIAVFIYMAAPAVLIVSFIFFFGIYLIYAVSIFIFTICIILFAYRVYSISGHKPYRQMNIEELNSQDWSYRIYERLGVAKKDIPVNVLVDYDLFKKFLIQLNVTVEEFESIVELETQMQKKREEDARIFSAEKFLRRRPIGLNWHFGYTVHLDRYVVDLTRFDVHKDMYSIFYGFAQEMNMIEVVLARPNENNVIIMGEPGIGRHMVIQELARRIRSGYFEATYMKHMRILQCDFANIMAQVRSEGGDPELVINNLFHEAAHAGNVILVVDNFEKYMHMEDSHGFSFDAIIDQYASMESFRMIAITTESGFYDHVNSNSMIMRYFDAVTIHEMNESDAMKVLFMRFYGKEHTPFTYQSLRQILAHSGKYTNTAPLPARAIDLAMEVFITWQGSSEQFITVQTVDNFIKEKTGVPVGKIAEGESEKLLSLEDTFHKYLVGQDDAVRNVAASVRRMRSGMAQSNKPAGSFLFLGPTGVGKTEMAKILADQYFGSRNKVIRLDMSEFQGDNALDRLIGSKELNQQGILTTAARENPYGLLLLDEIEKANPRVLDIFLQVLDEGFLHDSFGRKVSFTTMIIIATSNAVATTIKKMTENKVSSKKTKKHVIDTIIDSGAFRPEFLNRFGDIIIFQPLTKEHVGQVTVMLLDKFSKRMEEEHHFTVIFDDGVVDEIIKNGFDPVFGARSLIHYIDDVIADALAKKLIIGDVARGEIIQFTVGDMEN